MINFIQGQKFISLADFTFSPGKKLPGDYDNLVNTFRPEELHKDRPNIVYTHTMYVGSLFELLQDFLQYQFVVITHNSDNRISLNYRSCSPAIYTTLDGFGQNVDYFNLPSNVIMWFTKNVNCFDRRIEAIPIGLENDMWFPEISKKKKIEDKLKEPHSYKNLVYMNFNINTNPAKRQECYNYFKDFPWVTVDMKANGSGFDSYIDNLYNHKFVLCPEGNGIDTHRTWETLYLGSVPIEIGNENNRFWSDLPMVTVRNWQEVTVEYLAKRLDQMIEVEPNTEYLDFQYWKNKILRYVK
jgi:hypothetical protein